MLRHPPETPSGIPDGPRGADELERDGPYLSQDIGVRPNYPDRCLNTRFLHPGATPLSSRILLHKIYRKSLRLLPARPGAASPNFFEDFPPSESFVPCSFIESQQAVEKLKNLKKGSLYTTLRSLPLTWANPASYPGVPEGASSAPATIYGILYY